MKTFAPHRHHLLLAWSLSLCALVGGSALPMPAEAAPSGYTPQDYTPAPKAPPRPGSSSRSTATANPSAATTSGDDAQDDNQTPAAPQASKRQTRAYIFDRATFQRASEAIHKVLTPKATFLVQEQARKIIVQDEAVNIAIADALAVGLQPSVQGIPPTSGSYSKVTTPVNVDTGSDQGTSGIYMPRSSTGSTGANGQPSSGTQVSSTTLDGRSARVEIQVDMQENSSSAGSPAPTVKRLPVMKPGTGPLAPVSVPGSPAGSQVSTERPRRQVLVMDSGSTMRFQVNRSPQMEFFRRVATEAGYPTDKTGPAWKKVGTQIAVNPVTQPDGSIAVSVYPEIVVDVDGGVQQVMPLEDLGTSVTLSEGQEVSLALFPAGSEAFNDAFFGRKLSSSTMRALSGTITVRARLLTDDPNTTTAGNAPQVPLAPDPNQQQFQQNPQQPDDNSTYLYVGTELPYIDDSGYDYGYATPFLYTNYSYNYCQHYRFCRNIVAPICRDVLPDCNKSYKHNHNGSNNNYVNYNQGGGNRYGNGNSYSASSGYNNSSYYNQQQQKQVVLTRTGSVYNYGNNSASSTYSNNNTSTYNNPRYTTAQNSYYRNPVTPSSKATYTDRDGNKRPYSPTSVPAATPTSQIRYNYVSPIAPNPPNSTYYPSSNPYRQYGTSNPYRQSTGQSVNPYRSNTQQGTQQRYYQNR